MSVLSDIVAKLESGGGKYAAAQPPSMVDKTYGQYSGFVSQYGSGAAGVDNFANQVLAANPNATLGDFYSKYVLGTGNPGSSISVGDLTAQYPSAASNLTQNAGVPVGTPLGDLLGGSGTVQPSDQLPGNITVGNDPFGGFTIPNTSDQLLPAGSFDQSSLTDQFTNIFGGNPTNVPTGIAGPAGLDRGTPQSQSSPAAFWATLQADIVNYLSRFGLIIFGIVIVAIGGVAVIRGENLGGHLQGGLKRLTK